METRGGPWLDRGAEYVVSVWGWSWARNRVKKGDTNKKIQYMKTNSGTQFGVAVGKTRGFMPISLSLSGPFQDSDGATAYTILMT